MKPIWRTDTHNREERQGMKLTKAHNNVTTKEERGSIGGNTRVNMFLNMDRRVRWTRSRSKGRLTKHHGIKTTYEVIVGQNGARLPGSRSCKTELKQSYDSNEQTDCRNRLHRCKQWPAASTNTHFSHMADIPVPQLLMKRRGGTPAPHRD